MLQINETDAVRHILAELKRNNYSWTNIEYINKGRYAIVKGNPNIAILMKSEPFFNFGKKFQKEGQEGMGDSINCQALKLFITKEVKYIYTMFKDGLIYYISLQDFLLDSFRWVQKEGTEVRSISIHKYKKLKGG